MQWQGKESEGEGVQDRRGMKPGVAIGGGVGSLVVLALVYFLGVDPNQAKQIGNMLGGGNQPKQGEVKGIDDGYKEFSDTIFKMNKKIWAEQFHAQRLRENWSEPHMILFAESVNTKCGNAPSSVGPFYCPADRTVYLDPTFFNELEKKLGGSKAEFSQAYVIAHEVGHHVQNILGYNALVDRYKDEGENAGIRLELQADYLAGVWTHHAEAKYKLLEKGDIEEAIKTAKNIGDDAIQKRMKGKAWPESFNHGTSEQRYKYFKKGMESGDASKAALDKFFDRSVPPLKL